MDKFTMLIADIGGWLWGLPLMLVLAGFGVISTIFLGFPQVRYFAGSWKEVFANVLRKRDKPKGAMSSFQSLATAMAAQVSIGNIGGVGTAIVSGGAGAVFWMWVLAFLGMSTISVEAILAQKYRVRRNGNLVGGPAYYISYGLKNKGMEGLGKVLGASFAIMLVLALGLVGNMVQSNSIADALNTSFGLSPFVAGLVLALITGLIFLGGMERIGKFSGVVVPLMAIFYVLGSLLVLIKNFHMLGPVFSAIFKAAFSSKAVLGGTTGYAVKLAIRYGVARGLFSNEAGMGSTPNSHAVAYVDHPVQQGLVAMVGVFIDTMVVCTATAIIILTTGAHRSGAEGVGLTLVGLEIALGSQGAKFFAISMVAFAFTTLVGWYYFGETNVNYLTGGSKGAIRIYQVLVLAFIVLGSIQKVDFVWHLADLTNALMVIPNILGLSIMLSEAKGIYKDYEGQMASGKPLSFNYEYENL